MLSSSTELPDNNSSRRPSAGGMDVDERSPLLVPGIKFPKDKAIDEAKSARPRMSRHQSAAGIISRSLRWSL